MYIDCSPKEEAYLTYASNKKEDETPLLACILPADDPSARAYEQAIIAKSRKITAIVSEYCKDVTKIKECVKTWNEQPEIHGILLISPPKHLRNPHSLIVDHKNVEGNDFDDRLRRISCTARSIIAIMTLALNQQGGGLNAIAGCEEWHLKGKNVVIIGYGKAVGKPLSYLLMRHHIGSVTTIHKYSSPGTSFKAMTNADIIVSATGNPDIFEKASGRIPSERLEGKIIIDAGISRVSNKIVGDINPIFAENNLVSPVPGGVGAVTTAMILANTLGAYRGYLT